MAAAEVEGPFEYTATGILGEQRNTMLQNELHLRSKVGHVKTRGVEHPGKGFVYGSPSERRDLTVALALRGWAGSLPVTSAGTTAKSSPGRDFINLNKAALAGGLIKAPENFDFRAIHDIRQVPANKRAKSGKLALRRLPPTMVYGIPTRPSTPMFDLLEHSYQDKWIKEQHQQLLAKRSEEDKRRILSAPVLSRGHRIIYETKASVLRTYQNPVDLPPLWHLSRFTKSARPHIQTFRTDAAKSGALQNQETDKVARKGELGTGVYEQAKK